jgi:putative inorganic carbon (HCO3(-)) transporter
MSAAMWGQRLSLPVAATVLMFATQRLGPAAALAGCVGVAALIGVVMQPMVATSIVMFLVYLNVPAVLTQRFGLSELLAGSVIALLVVPIGVHCVLRREPLKGGDVLGLMVLFLASAMLSTTVAVDRLLALSRVEGLLIEGLLLYWLVINAVRDTATLRGVLFALLAAGTLVSALCAYQDLTGAYQQDFGGLAHRNYEEERDAQVLQLGERGRFSRAQGPVNEPNRFAQIMIVLLPFAFYLHRVSRPASLRLLARLMGGAVLCGVLLTLSRGAMVSLALMAAAAAVIGWVRASRLTIAAIAAVAILPIAAPFAFERVASIANVTRLTDNADPRAADGAIRGRATEMLAAVYVFLDHPISGVGPGQFAKFYVQDYSRNSDIQFRDLDGARRAHSLYLELAAEQGLVGLGTFAAIMTLLMRRLWRAQRSARSASEADLAAACWLSLLAYLSTGFFLHLSYQRYFWLLLALCVCALHQVKSADHARFGRT